MIAEDNPDIVISKLSLRKGTAGLTKEYKLWVSQNNGVMLPDKWWE